MKANLFIHNNAFEILMANGTVFNPIADETQEDFVARISAEVEAEYLEAIELKEVDAKAIKKVGTKQLVNRLKKATGLAKEIIQDVLIERGAIEAPEAPEVIEDEKPINPIEIKEEAPEAPEIDFSKLTKEELIAEIARLQVRPKKRVSEPKHTLEEVESIRDEAKPNVGKKCNFTAYNSEEVLTGVINGVWIDKRVPMALYRIKLADGSMKNKVVLTNEIEIFEPTTEELAAKAEKLAAKVKPAKAVAVEPTVVEVEADETKEA